MRRTNVFLGEEDDRHIAVIREYLEKQLPAGYNKQVTVSDVVRWALAQRADQIRRQKEEANA